MITNGVSGFTNYHWVATNPNPSGTCSGYTPVSSQTFNGTVFNKGNDTASNNWSNSSSLSGSDSLETNLILTPTGENTTAGGWGAYITTAYNFVEGLVDTTSYDPPDPNNNKFQGRQVYESGTGPGSDACFNAAAKASGITPNVGQLYVAGAIWNVGASTSGGYTGNQYGYDTVGYNPTQVSYYRKYPSILPCTTTLQQTMQVVNNVPGQPASNAFANHTLKVTIGTNSITVQKDGLVETIAR